MKPLSDQVIYEHLAGNRTVGVYPLLTDDTCRLSLLCAKRLRPRRCGPSVQHGEDQLAQGKVKPVAEVVKRLRRVK